MRRVRAGGAGPVQTEMARRKFRSNQRHEPTTERSFQEFSYNLPAPQTSRTELLRLVRGGEDTFLELKVKLSNPERIAQVSFDSGRRVVAIDVEGKRRPYQTRDGRYFIRVGADTREATREELSSL